jgi:hypothetical protein
MEGVDWRLFQGEALGGSRVPTTDPGSCRPDRSLLLRNPLKLSRFVIPQLVLFA